MRRETPSALPLRARPRVRGRGGAVAARCGRCGRAPQDELGVLRQEGQHGEEAADGGDEHAKAVRGLRVRREARAAVREGRLDAVARRAARSACHAATPAPPAALRSRWQRRAGSACPAAPPWRCAALAAARSPQLRARARLSAPSRAARGSATRVQALAHPQKGRARVFGRAPPRVFGRGRHFCARAALPEPFTRRSRACPARAGGATRPGPCRLARQAMWLPSTARAACQRSARACWRAACSSPASSRCPGAALALGLLEGSHASDASDASDALALLAA